MAHSCSVVRVAPLKLPVLQLLQLAQLFWRLFPAVQFTLRQHLAFCKAVPWMNSKVPKISLALANDRLCARAILERWSLQMQSTFPDLRPALAHSCRFNLNSFQALGPILFVPDGRHHRQHTIAIDIAPSFSGAFSPLCHLFVKHPPVPGPRHSVLSYCTKYPGAVVKAAAQYPEIV
jgi:hypothetical protein